MSDIQPHRFKRLIAMIRLGRKFLLPRYPSTYAEARNIVIFPPSSSARFTESMANRGNGLNDNGPGRSTHCSRQRLSRVVLRRPSDALDAAGTDALGTCNRAALEETLQILREAIRYAKSFEPTPAANNSAPDSAEPPDHVPASDVSISSTDPRKPCPLAVPATDYQIPDRRDLIDQFIVRVRAQTGERIKKADIWKVAGYKEDSEFQRFQRVDKRTTKKATAEFKRVLAMDSRQFLKCLAEVTPDKGLGTLQVFPAFPGPPGFPRLSFRFPHC